MEVEELTQLPRRTVVALTQKRRAGLVAAVFPIHYPRALLRAFNIQPIEVWGPPGAPSNLGAAHVQPYICSIVRNALSFLLSGGLEVTDLFLVPHACDSLQGLGSVLLDFVKPHQPIVPLYLPRNRDHAGIEFLTNELSAIYQTLQRITQSSPSDAQLSDCIETEEEADHWLRKLHGDHGLLSISDYERYRIIRAREFLPAEQFVSLAQQALAQRSKGSQVGIPVVLSGILPEPMSIFQAINASGGTVVADDLACCGRRLYPPGESDDPFRRMAERILKGPPDSSRGSSVEERLQNLLEIVESCEARGVIFYNVKFCDPELFYIPDLRAGLSEAGLPSVVIEIDISDSLSQQNLTRLEAFFEMLS